MIETLHLSPHLVLAVESKSPDDVTHSQSAAAQRSARARRCGVEAIRHLSASSSAALSAPSSLEYAPPPIGRGPQGEPLFPAPFIGSLAHTTGFACALVTNEKTLLSVGVDIESLHRPFRPAVAARIASASEREAIAAWHQNEAFPSYWRSGLALFCAKEAAFKALSPLLQRPLVLSDIPLTCTPEANRFELSAEAGFAQSLHGYIITWHDALIAYGAVSGASTYSSPSSERLPHED